MISDWIYVEKQMTFSVSVGSEPVERKYLYVWQCRYCGVREVTTTPEMPTHGCKCLGNHDSITSY